jgi:hypothetical protein
MQNLTSKTSAQVAEAQTPFAKMFNQFFTDLMAVRPAWKQAFPTDEHLKAAKNQWSIALIEAKVNQAQLNHGMRKVRQSAEDFFPSVGKFLELCKPTAADYGLPTFETAYREVSSKCGYVGFVQWSHPAVYHAITQVGIYDFGRMTQDKALSAFKNAYKLTVEAVMRGETLPQVPKAIERKPPEKARAEVANKHLSAMRALLGH